MLFLLWMPVPDTIARGIRRKHSPRRTRRPPNPVAAHGDCCNNAPAPVFALASLASKRERTKDNELLFQIAVRHYRADHAVAGVAAKLLHDRIGGRSRGLYARRRPRARAGHHH